MTALLKITGASQGMGHMSDRNCFLTLSLTLALLLLAGCAARLPVGVAIAPAEQEAVTASYRQWQEEQRECPSSLDGAVTLTLRAWPRSGTLSGFVQAREPALLRFVALNPLGQPMMMLVTDGEWFRLVSVPEATSYEGSVEAAAFEKYAPEGMRAGHAFFWLTGRVPPEISQIDAVTREERATAYWLELAGEDRLRHRILYDPRLEVLHRHQVVDEWRSVLVDVGYADFQSIPGTGENNCLLPGTITVETRRQRGRMIIELNDWLIAPRLQPADFYLEAPPGFERILVQ
jgi:hypothetical protein